MEDTLQYGPVICLKGPHKGRIGCLDDEEYDRGRRYGIVYFSDPLLCPTYYRILYKDLSNDITMNDVLERREELMKRIVLEESERKKAELLRELNFVTILFYEKHIEVHTLPTRGTKLFISHSSQDKGFANILYADLKKEGCIPWLDQWDIAGGQSIPTEIEKGIDSSDFLLMLLSNHSVKSNWVRAEWESAIWEETTDRQIRVIPLLIEECEIPRFLKCKKYIDFTKGYREAFRDLLYSIEQLLNNQNKLAREEHS